MMPSMLMDSFKDTVDWKKLTKLKAVIDAEVALSRFKRVCEAVFSVDDERVSVTVEFLRDNEYRHYVKCELDVGLELECQRCMSSVPYAIEKVSFEVYFVTNEEQLNKLPSELDALLVDESEVNLLALIEDELLLQLPFTIFHEEIEACDQNFRYNSPQIDKIPVEKGKENPFKVLETLKNKS